MVDLRLLAAMIAGRAAGFASRLLKVGGGTTLPGAIAERVDGRALAKLSANLTGGTILVTGTNGKTTTSRVLATILAKAGYAIVHNRAGANLTSGLTTALLRDSGLGGRPRAEWGLFEVDEAVMPGLIESIRPTLVVMTNLFRDQLDRYGEIDYIAGVWRRALQTLPESSTIILNADDPTVASLGRGLRARVVAYGVNAPSGHEAIPDAVADSTSCPFCGAHLVYDQVQYAHLGSYACPEGDFRRPEPDFRVSSLVHHGVESTEMVVEGPFGQREWQVGLPGLYNSYNMVAAVAAAISLGAEPSAIDDSLEEFRTAFGRFERMEAQQRTLCVILVKNPVGFTQVIRTILATEGDHYLALVLNDNLADGTDVSWIWDVEFEELAGHTEPVVVGGSRGGDMALRLKYAGVSAERIAVTDSIEETIDRGLAAIPEGATLYALPTYTALIELRAIAARRRYAKSSWES